MVKICVYKLVNVIEWIFLQKIDQITRNECLLNFIIHFRLKMNAEQLHHLNVNRLRIDSSVYRRSKYEELFVLYRV